MEGILQFMYLESAPNLIVSRVFNSNFSTFSVAINKEYEYILSGLNIQHCSSYKKPDHNPTI